MSISFNKFNIKGANVKGVTPIFFILNDFITLVKNKFRENQLTQEELLLNLTKKTFHIFLQEFRNRENVY